MTPLCFVDTETDGLHPGRQVWEVAIIRRDDAGEREYHAFVDISIDAADSFALNVGGFYERHPLGQHLAGAPYLADPTPEVEVAIEVARLTHGACLIGINTGFDAAGLDPLLRRHGLLPAWNYRPIPVESMAAGWLAARQPGNLWIAPPWKSDDLAHAVAVLHDDDIDLSPSADDRHTALGDARWAMRWYDAMTGGVR